MRHLEGLPLGKLSVSGVIAIIVLVGLVCVAECTLMKCVYKCVNVGVHACA